MLQKIIIVEIVWLYNAVMGLEDRERMANSVDPDQTAPLGAV